MSQQALVVALHSQKNPCIYVHNIFKGNGFWPFGWVCLISVHNSNPRNCCLETEIRSWFRYRNVFDEDRLSHPRLGQVSFFWESTLLLGMIIQLEVMWYSRHRFFISFVLLQVAWRIVLFHFKQRHSTVWIISDLQEVVWIYVHYLAASFPTTPRWCEEQQCDVL